MAEVLQALQAEVAAHRARDSVVSDTAARLLAPWCVGSSSSGTDINSKERVESERLGIGSTSTKDVHVRKHERKHCPTVLAAAQVEPVAPEEPFLLAKHGSELRLPSRLRKVAAHYGTLMARSTALTVAEQGFVRSVRARAPPSPVAVAELSAAYERLQTCLGGLEAADWGVLERPPLPSGSSGSADALCMARLRCATDTATMGARILEDHYQAIKKELRPNERSVSTAGPPLECERDQTLYEGFWRESLCQVLLLRWMMGRPLNRPLVFCAQCYRYGTFSVAKTSYRI